MKYIKFLSEGKQIKLLTESILWFGLEITFNEDKKGMFKSFNRRLWVKDLNSTYYLDKDSTTLSKIRANFPHYDLTSREYKKTKNGKIVKAIQRTYEVLSKDVIKVNDEEAIMIRKAIKNSTLFVLKNVTYYRLFDNFYRKLDEHIYLMYDNTKRVLHNTNLTFQTVSKQKLIDFRNTILPNNEKEKANEFFNSNRIDKKSSPKRAKVSRKKS